MTISIPNLWIPRRSIWTPPKWLHLPTWGVTAGKAQVNSSGRIKRRSDGKYPVPTGTTCAICGCSTPSPCVCDSGTGFYQFNKTLSFTGLSIPTGSCLFNTSGPTAHVNFSIVNPNQAGVVVPYSSGGGGNPVCIYTLATTSASDASYSDCSTNTAIGVLYFVESVPSGGGLAWSISLSVVQPADPLNRLFGIFSVGGLALSCGGNVSASNTLTYQVNGVGPLIPIGGSVLMIDG